MVLALNEERAGVLAPHWLDWSLIEHLVMQR